jgi:hypothetical protein
MEDKAGSLAIAENKSMNLFEKETIATGVERRICGSFGGSLFALWSYQEQPG